MTFCQRLPALSILLSTALLQAALAATPTADPAHRQYDQDRAHCLAGDSGEDRDTCLREAAAALQEAQRPPETRSAEPASDYQANALARCQVHRNPEDRQSCELRMRAPASGSIPGGGLLREATETVYPPAPRQP